MVDRAVYQKIMRYQKTGVDVFFSIFSTVQQSGQTMVTQALEQSSWIPSYGKKSYTSWMQECAKGIEVMKDFVDQGYSGMDRFWPQDLSQKPNAAPAATPAKKEEAIKTLTASGPADIKEVKTPEPATAKPAAKTSPPAKAKATTKKATPRKTTPSRKTSAKAASTKTATAKAAPKKRATPRKATSKTTAAPKPAAKAATNTTAAAKALSDSSSAPAKTAVKSNQAASSAGKSDS